MKLLIRAAGWARGVLWRIFRPVTFGVKLLLIHDGRVLLVRHTYVPGWLLPGGGLKRGETLEQAARREAAEELGAHLGSLTLLGVYSNFAEGKSDHLVVLTCQEFTLSPVTSAEIEEVALFDLEALPPDISPGTRRRVDECRLGIPTPAVAVW
jgi:ADP-ribose pyrophosphatase YjhB (NUDIX family)